MRAEKIAKKQNNLLLEEPNVTILVIQTVRSPATKLRDSRVCRKPGSPIQARRNRGCRLPPPHCVLNGILCGHFMGIKMQQ